PRSNDGQQPRKRARTAGRRERSESEQAHDLADIMRALEEEFAEKERLSHGQTWCTPVSHERKVKTVEEFYKAFYDARTLPILTCKFCYRKHSRDELEEVEYLGRGGLSPAALLHTRLGCEHMFPDELKDLTPVEEKLIALNSCYGFITEYSIPDGHRQSVRYLKHIKGYITVFPNNVQELVTNVLLHPLLKVLDEIHVSWQGSKRPAPSDLSALLSVRRRVVERALLWLKRHNPLYADIKINETELSS
ncbi:hypothetical protein B0J15DRAFT_379153, partial [Fusarium solani]